MDLYSVNLAKLEQHLPEITFLYGYELQLATKGIFAGLEGGNKAAAIMQGRLM